MIECHSLNLHCLYFYFLFPYMCSFQILISGLPPLTYYSVFQYSFRGLIASCIQLSRSCLIKVILDSLLFYSSMLLDTYSYLSSSCPLWCILNSSHCCILCICYLFPFISIFFFHFPPFISITSVPYRTQLVGHSFFLYVFLIKTLWQIFFNYRVCRSLNNLD